MAGRPSYANCDSSLEFGIVESMNRERHRRIEELFYAALELPAEKREAFVAEVCTSDGELMAEVLSLLQHDRAETSAALGAPEVAPSVIRAGIGQAMGAVAPAPSPSADDLPSAPREVGGYRLLSVLGEGGMGVVYRAEQDNPRRTVALKVIKPGYATPQTLKRFELEANVLGRLQHAGIAQIFEAGTATVQGRPQPFFAMELIDGVPLTEYAAQRHLDVPARVALLATICDAVAHAHAKGVVHRDLKPGNLLVSPEGQAKVLDFGVARMTHADIQMTTMSTEVGALVGTLAYMSPEQASGNVDDVDHRSDIYTLGVIGYELLSGRLPYSIRGRMVHDAVSVIRVEEPTRLSQISRAFRGDLDTIFTKALEKEKSRRYQSASELADDLRRYLNHEAISARPPSAMYQLRKFARRHVGLVAGLACTFLALVGGLVGVSWFWWQALQDRDAAQNAQVVAQNAQRAAELAREAEAGQRREAELERDRAKKAEELANAQRAEAEMQTAIAQAINDFLNDDLLAAVDPGKMGRDVTMRAVLDAAAERIQEGVLHDQPEVERSVNYTIGTTYQALGLYPEAERHLRLALSAAERLPKPNPGRVAQANNNLALILMIEGKYDEAEALFRKAQQQWAALYGEVHPDIAALLNNLAGLYRERGDFADAESAYRQSLDMRRQLYGERSTPALQSSNNLAVLLSNMGRFAEAEELQRFTFEARVETLGEEHPDALRAMNNLAATLELSSKREEAEALYRRCLAGRIARLGEDHPDVSETQNNLGRLLGSTGRAREGAELLERSLEIARKVYGDDHTATLITMNNLGYTYYTLGEYDKAAGLFQQSLDGVRRAVGDGQEAMNPLHNLALVRWRTGALDEAESMFRHAIEVRREKLGPEHPRTLQSMTSLGRVLKDKKEFGQAEAIMREGLELRRKRFGEPHAEVLTALRDLAELLYDVGKHEDADPLWAQAVQMARALNTEDLPTLLNYQAMNHLKRNRPVEAEGLLRESLALREQSLPPGHWLIANTRSLLGEALLTQDRLEEAEPLLLDSQAALATSPETTPQRLDEATQRVLLLYEKWGKPQQAEAFKAKIANKPIEAAP